MIPEPKNPIAVPAEPCVTERILRILKVLSSVDLDDEPLLDAGEVHNVRADWNLPSEARP